MIVKIGHRGAMGHAPENTLFSFRKAMELLVDMVELDVHLCNTGEVVVIHDNKVNRTTNGRGRVSKKTLQELRQLDAGAGEKIPTLSEVLDLLQRKVKINIELKGKGTAGPVSECINRYIENGGWTYDDFLASSFDRQELAEFAGLNQRTPIAIITVKRPGDFTEFCKQEKAFSVNLFYKSVTENFLAAAHDRGLKVYVWTVNEQDDIENMKELGVDGICSNYPDRL